MTFPQDSSESRACAILVAAGDSTRMGQAGLPRKPFIELEGRTVLAHACAAFEAASSISTIVIVAREDDVTAVQALAQGRPEFSKLHAVVPGGANRTASVRAGVRASEGRSRWVAIHDAARPLIQADTIDRAVSCAAERGAALVAIPASDTIKESADGSSAFATLDRSRLWSAQTPQVFERATFLELLEHAEAEGLAPTDDAALYEHYIGPIPLVHGESTNLKLTTLTDLAIARAILRECRDEGATS